MRTLLHAKTLSAAFSQVCHDEQCLKDTRAMMKDESHSLSIRIRAVCALRSRCRRYFGYCPMICATLKHWRLDLVWMTWFGHASDKLLKQGIEAIATCIPCAKVHENIEMMTFLAMISQTVLPQNSVFAC